MAYSIVSLDCNVGHLEAVVRFSKIIEMSSMVTIVFLKGKKSHKLVFAGNTALNLTFTMAQELIDDGSLITLEIKSCHIAEDVARNIASIITSNETIEVVKLSSINVESMPVICDALTHLTSLKSFTVDSCFIDKSAGSLIASVISNNVTLHHVIILNSNCNNDITEDVCRAIKSVRALLSLHLHFGSASDAAVHELANAVQSFHLLKDLKLYESQVSHINIIASSLKNAPLNNLSISKQSSFKEDLKIHPLLETIESLDLTSCKLKESEFVQMLTHLIGTTTIKSINLSSNVITANVASSLARVLDSCNLIESVILLDCKLSEVNCFEILTSLDNKTSLKCLEFNVESTKRGKNSSDLAVVLGSILANNKFIEQVVLPNCDNGAMIATLDKLSSLRHLDLHSSKVLATTLIQIVKENVALRYLDISSCGISYKSFNEIFRNMLPLRSLEYLNLSGNAIVDSEVFAGVVNANINLRHLNISHCQIDTVSLVEVVKALQNKKFICYLDISYSLIVKTTAIELAKVFGTNKYITHLSFSCCAFEFQSFCEIIPPLKLFCCLKYLDLSNIVANCQSVTDDISNLINNNKALQHLNLSNCKLSGPNVIKVAASLLKLSMLKHLDISHNEITNEAAIAIASTISNNPSLQYLFLSDCSLQESGMLKIAIALTSISSLLCLDMSNNKFTTKVELEIANVIYRNSFITKLYFSNCFVSNGCFHIFKAIQTTTTLKALDLDSLVVSDSQDDLLFRGLSIDSNLEYLNLSNYRLTQSSLLALLASLQHITVLQHLNLNSTKVTEQLAETIATVICSKFINYLSLQNCKLSSLSIKIISKALRKVSSLKHFDLSFNTINNTSGDDIASIISNNMLEHLNLSNCNMRDHALIAVASELSKINCLLYLNLSDNFITRQAATKIGDVIYSNNTMRELHLCNCLGPDTSSIILSAAAQKFALKCLNLSSNITTPNIIASLVHHSLLEYLDLSYCDLPEPGFLQILDGFVKVNSLQYINIESNIVTDIVAQKLASVFSASNKVQHLNVSRCNLSSLHFAQIVKVHRLSSLQYLDVSHNIVTNDSAVSIASLLGDIKWTLEYFNISNCSLLAYGMKTIAEALVQASHLRFLDISNNSINGHSAKKVAAALRYHSSIQHLNISNCFTGEHSIPIFEAIRTKTTLKHFNTAKNPINDKIANVMSDVIQNNSNLEYLNFSQCGLSETGFLSILNGMNQICTLKHFDISSNKINENVAKQLTNVVSTLSHLNLSNTELKSLQLFRYISSVDTDLQHLDLSQNETENQESEALTKVLRDSTAIEYLDFSWTLLQETGVHAILSVLINKTSLRHLNLQSCTINNEVSQLLATFIANNTRLSYLNLSKTKLQQEGVVFIAKALKKSHSISHLILNSNCIPNEAAKEISLAIKYHLPLKHLSMFSCKLDQSGLIYIAKSLETISSLYHLDFSDMVILDKAAAIIASAISNNPGIQYLDFEQCIFQVTGMQKINEVLPTLRKLKQCDF